MSQLLEGIESMHIEYIQPFPRLTPPDQKNFASTKTRLLEAKKVLLNAARIASLTEVPEVFVSPLQGLINDLFTLYRDFILDTDNKSSSEAAEHFRVATDRIKEFHTRLFEPQSGNRNMFLLNSINTYATDVTKGADLKSTELISKLQDQIERAASLNKEIHEKAAKLVISDYAIIFKDQETKYRKISRSWLATSIILSAAFVVFLMLSLYWFNVKTTLKSIESGEVMVKEVFNYPLLISKILIISFIIFLITFAFKQYSVYKNLEVLSQHRKNSLNSYVLFEASLATSEQSIKNLLLMQLAKSIYEFNTTGFLNPKQSDHSMDFIDWGKVISAVNK
jgi:hypothetical protein